MTFVTIIKLDYSDKLLIIKLDHNELINRGPRGGATAADSEEGETTIETH
jgi:hypothetical protein